MQFKNGLQSRAAINCVATVINFWSLTLSTKGVVVGNKYVSALLTKGKVADKNMLMLRNEVTTMYLGDRGQ